MKAKEAPAATQQLVAPETTPTVGQNGGTTGRRPRSFTPVVAGSAAEVRPDTERLVSHVASLYGSHVSMDNSRLSINTPFCAFEKTGLAERIRGDVSNGYFNGLAYWDSGWTSAGGGLMLDKMMALDPGRDAEVRVEITAKHTELNQVAAGRASSAGTAGGSNTSSRGTTSSSSLNLRESVSVGAGEEQAQGTSTAGSTGLTMDLPAKAYASALVFDVKVSFKPLLGPAVVKQGPVIAGEMLIKSAMALSSADQ